MRIALLGYGKMGQLIEQIAENQGHEIIAKGSPSQIKSQDLSKADVCIDFSHATCVLDHIRLCIDQNKPLVIGTTGWEKELPQARNLVENSPIACLYSPNFSIGVHLFMRLITQAAALVAGFEQYDVAGMEIHHNQKADRPSGTAKALHNLLSEQIPGRSIPEFSSMRCGQHPGTHTICFDSAADTITLTHQARSREGFASGAIKAAEWMIGKKGFFTVQDWLATYSLAKDQLNAS
jgi:4-hydroxy-tetrahydrodipicolinate reductase